MKKWLNKLFGFIDNVSYETNDMIEARIKSTVFVLKWMLVVTIISFANFLFGFQLVWGILSIISFQFVIALNDGQKQDKLILEIRSR